MRKLARALAEAWSKDPMLCILVVLLLFCVLVLLTQPTK